MWWKGCWYDEKIVYKAYNQSYIILDLLLLQRGGKTATPLI